MQVLSPEIFVNFHPKDEFPLEISDIRPDDTSNYHKNHWGGGTFLLDWGTFSLDQTENGLALEYSLSQSKSDYIAEKMVNAKLFLESHQREDGFWWEQIPESDGYNVWEQFREDATTHEYNIQSGKIS